MKVPELKELQTQEDIERLERENAELKAQVEQLRLAALKAISFMSGGEAKADLRDAYDSAPDQCLAEVKAQAVDDALQTWRLCSDNNLRVNLQFYAHQLRQQAKGDL